MTESTSSQHKIWIYLVLAWLAFMILAGGTSLPSTFVVIIQTSTSLLVLAWALWLLREGFPTTIAALGCLLAFGALCLVMVQTIPLPFEVWQAFPGRQLVGRSFAFFSTDKPYFPVSLSAASTWSAAAALLPGIAGYTAALTFKKPEFQKIAMVFVGCAILGVIVSVLQRLQGPQSFWYFYGNLGNNNTTGTFANRNFFGTQLFSTIPFIAALAMTARENFRLRGIFIAGFAVVYIAMLVVGLGTTGSRSAIVFAIVSVFTTLFYVYRANAGPGNPSRMMKSVLAVTALLVILSQVGMVAILRLAKTDQVSEYRDAIYVTSLETAKSFFPVGSGFGTFSRVYQMFETPDNILDRFVNHAHNDWLEIVVEGGLPALILLFLFVAVFVSAIVMASRASFAVPAHAYFRAAVLAATLQLLHSVFDFPLRTPAMMVYFAVCCGMMALSGGKEKSMPQSPQQRYSKTAHRPAVSGQRSGSFRPKI